jgi:hypothetical protein
VTSPTPGWRRPKAIHSKYRSCRLFRLLQLKTKVQGRRLSDTHLYSIPHSWRTVGHRNVVEYRTWAYHVPVHWIQKRKAFISLVLCYNPVLCLYRCSFFFGEGSHGRLLQSLCYTYVPLMWLRILLCLQIAFEFYFTQASVFFFREKNEINEKFRFEVFKN